MIMGYWGYPRYVSVAEKRAKAARKLKQLKKKNPDIKPILLEGRAIAHTLMPTKTDPSQLKQSNPSGAQRFVKTWSLARENNL